VSLSTKCLACTLFSAAANGHVFFGNNEDSPHAYPSKMWFVPSSPGAHGRVCFGWFAFAQGGMNDQGLAIDWAVTPPQGRSSSAKPPLDASVVERVLANCATVKEVINLFETHTFVGNDAHFMVADRNGDSVVGEWVQGEFRIIRKKGDHQVLTNFLLTDSAAGNYPCERYEKVDRILDKWTWLTVGKCVSALREASAEWGTGGTKYSNLYELKEKKVYVYYRRDYEKPLILDLSRELAKGFREVDLKEWHDCGDVVLEPKRTFPRASIPADQVLRKAARARGGRAAWARIRSFTTTGRVELGWTEKGTVTMISERPDRFHQTVRLEGSGTFERGYDGKQAFVSNSYHDVPLFHGKTDLEAKEEAEFFCWFDASEAASGQATPAFFAGRDCYAIQRGGGKTTDYYDAISYLFAGSRTEMMTTTGATWSMAWFSDYRAVDEFLFPMTIHVKQEGDVHKFRLENYVFNNLPVADGLSRTSGQKNETNQRQDGSLPVAVSTPRPGN
ncbi:MAG: carcinine hydrolase/isopenicillin-N N-acyltransferase family protein, partial [Cytophagaceae bacterium]